MVNFMEKNRFLRPEMDGRRGRRRRERDRANGMDERNPYGSKGGYVTSSKRGRDRAMDGRDYHPEYDSRYDSRYDANYGASNGHYGFEQHREYNRPVEYEIYGEMTYKDRNREDYYSGNNRSDYHYENYGQSYNDYSSEDPKLKYKEELEKWIKKMKNKDRFQISKQEVISRAKQMGINFEEFTEEEYYAIYLAMVTVYKNIGNDPQKYLDLAKQFLEDDDIELSPSEKVYAYLNYIVLGKELKEDEV